MVLTSAVLMSFAVGVSMAETTTTPLFTDVNSSTPHYTAIKYLKEHGVIGGYPDGSFKPDQVVNRAEALKIILLGSGETVAASASEDPFVDVPAAEWFAPYIVKAKSLGVVEGYEDGTFKPAQTVNLVENLKMLLLTKKIDVSTLLVTSNPYADAFMGEWYAKYVQYAKNKNLIDANSDNMIFPAQGMTRAKLAEAMYRLVYIQENDMEMYVPGSEQTTEETTEQTTQEPTTTEETTQETTQETPVPTEEVVSCKTGYKTSTAAELTGLVNDTDTSIDLDFTDGTEDELTGDVIAPGQVLLIDEEMMVVTAYDEPSNVAEVVRGFAKTTKATHAMGAAVRVSSIASKITNIRSGSTQFDSETGISVEDNTGLVAGRDIAVLSDTTDLEYENLTSFNAGTNWNVTRGLYGTTAMEHPELTTMVIQFSGACGVNAL